MSVFIENGLEDIKFPEYIGKDMRWKKIIARLNYENVKTNLGVFSAKRNVLLTIYEYFRLYALNKEKTDISINFSKNEKGKTEISISNIIKKLNKKEDFYIYDADVKNFKKNEIKYKKYISEKNTFTIDTYDCDYEGRNRYEKMEKIYGLPKEMWDIRFLYHKKGIEKEKIKNIKEAIGLIDECEIKYEYNNGSDEIKISETRETKIKRHKYKKYNVDFLYRQLFPFNIINISDVTGKVDIEATICRILQIEQGSQIKVLKAPKSIEQLIIEGSYVENIEEVIYKCPNLENIIYFGNVWTSKKTTKTIEEVVKEIKEKQKKYRKSN